MKQHIAIAFPDDMPDHEIAGHITKFIAKQTATLAEQQAHERRFQQHAKHMDDSYKQLVTLAPDGKRA